MAEHIQSLPNQTELPYQRHSDTSKAAAESLPNPGTLRARILEFLQARKLHGATDEEICNRFDLNPSTARPRRIELVQAGFVHDGGERRRVNSGRQATVWVATGTEAG